MTYKEIEKLAKKEMEELIAIWDFDEEAKRKIYLAFCQGFLHGEAHQMQVQINREQNRIQASLLLTDDLTN